MRKRGLSLLLTCCLILLGIGAGKEPESLDLMLSSDLHFTLHTESAIYPLINETGALCETIANEVCEAKPDAFLLCGDNTNSGRAEDAEALARILHRIHAARIPVIVIPGNHDFDLGSPESFRLAYGDLCEAEAVDTASLSYMLHLGSFRILAMDDSSFSRGARGFFCCDTMNWLRMQLDEAKQMREPVIFLSHYNVLPGVEAAEGSRYMIQNPELRDLLESYDVRLCLSGHRHSQEVLNHGELYEIVSGMPAVSPHLIGSITIRAGKLSYHADSIDFESFAHNDTLRSLLEQEQASGGNLSAVISRLENWDQLRPDEQEAILRLFRSFMESYGSGTLADVRDTILNDPYCERFLAAFAETNYGPWIRYLLETSNRAGNRLELDFSDILSS